MTSTTSFDRLFRLDGHVAIVTGGAGRLGSQYVRVLASAGASVAALRRAGRTRSGRPAADRRELVRRIVPSASTSRSAAPLTPSPHRSRTSRRADDPRQQRRASVPRPLTPRSKRARSRTTRRRAWSAMIDSHLKRTLVASQAFIAAFRDARKTRPALAGSIINVSSTYGVVTPDQSRLRLSPARRRRILQAGRLQRREIGRAQLHALAGGVLRAVRRPREHAGPWRRAGSRRTRRSSSTEYMKRTPLGRMATDEDYNGAIVFLASNASAYMTGATLVVDGGWTAR